MLTTESAEGTEKFLKTVFWHEVHRESEREEKRERGIKRLCSSGNVVFCNLAGQLFPLCSLW